MTGAERAWASRYQIDDVVRYSRGSKFSGVDPKSYGIVIGVNPVENLFTIQKGGGDQFSYDPKRLSGVAVYREVERQFSVGDRIQFTAPDKQISVANRELGMIEKIDKNGNIALRLEDGQTIQFKASQHPHFDHGYAVTSHGSQGTTADRVLINVDTAAGSRLINSRLAYVFVSRARIDSQIFTDDFSGLGQKLEHDVAKTSAVDFSQSPNHATSGAGLGLDESV
jgi:hypothetical protein